MTNYNHFLFDYFMCQTSLDGLMDNLKMLDTDYLLMNLGVKLFNYVVLSLNIVCELVKQNIHITGFTYPILYQYVLYSGTLTLYLVS